MGVPGVFPDHTAWLPRRASGSGIGPHTTEATLADPAADRLARFLKASLAGWAYAVAHQDGAVKIVLQNDTAGARTAAHQTKMMSEVAKLIPSGAGHGLGYLDDAACKRTVDELMRWQG